jgi:hypothetical protein
MSFEDLPEDWSDRSLDDPVLAADVIDLFVPDRDRAGGCVAMLLCDDDNRLLTPLVIAEVEEEDVDDALDYLLGHVLPMLARDEADAHEAGARAGDSAPDAGRPSAGDAGASSAGDAERHGSGAVGIARGRPSGLVPTDVDRERHQRVIDACQAEGVRLLGCWLLTPGGVETLPAPLAATP